jgi:nitroreductase
MALAPEIARFRMETWLHPCFPMKSKNNGGASRRAFLRGGATAGAGFGLGGAVGSETLSNETIGTIRALHTTHGNFANKTIPDTTLRTILQCSIRAANASNNQSYSIVVVTERGMMKEICGYQAGCLLLYCADYNRLKASAEALGDTFDPSNIESLLLASTNACLAAQTAVIAARSLGIDSLLTNGIHRGDMRRIWKLLDLPETHCFPVIALLLGYAASAPAYSMGRLDGAGIIHNGKYHRATPAEVQEIIGKYDDKKLHLGINENWDKEGYKHYLDWYFKAFLGPRAAAPKQETQMLRLIRRSGFLDLQQGTSE